MLEHATFERIVGTAVGSYRLEQLIGRDEFGPIFQARNGATSTTARLRLLPVETAPAPETAKAYLARFQNQASHVAQLQHPYLLPLLDYGIFRGMPYLVWPQVVMRSLSIRVAQNGPMDVLTVGRYLDQIAAALEYAHEHDTLHRSLTTDCVFIQLDGQLVVGDLGVRRIFELTASEAQVQALAGMSDACAPEQVKGGRVYKFTDVYALGALTYRLLTGYSVFAGGAREDIAQQHVYSQVLPLSVHRPGLPAGLDNVLAGALAKDPEQRFQHPGAFANAYHQLIDPTSGTRVPFVTSEPDEPSAQRQAAASDLMPPPRAEQSRRSQPPGRNGHSGQVRGTAGPAPRTAGASQPPVEMPGISLPGISLPGVSSPGGYGGRDSGGHSPRSSRSRFGRIAASAALIVMLAMGGLFILKGGTARGPGLSGGPTATVAFLDRTVLVGGLPDGKGDALQIVANGLVAPAAGYHYQGWMVNTATEAIIALGVFAPGANGYTLKYQAGSNLLTLGDTVEVTLEQGNVKKPVGRVVLKGSFPKEAFAHIQHLLVSYPDTPNKIGLLVGLLIQTQQVDAQASVLQNAMASRDTVAIRCVTQSILDILEGSKGPHYAKLGAGCASRNIALVGDGFGLLGPNEGYLAEAADHASLAATQPDATDLIRLHASHVQLALTNIKNWLTAVNNDALKLLSTPTDAALAAQAVALCNQAYNGVRPSADQTPGPYADQAGAITAYDHGQFMATLTLSQP